MSKDIGEELLEELENGRGAWIGFYDGIKEKDRYRFEQIIASEPERTLIKKIIKMGRE